MFGLFHLLECVAYQRIKFMVFGPIKVKVPGSILVDLVFLIQRSAVLTMRGSFVENSLGL
jgi:hypothetical protein